MFAHAILRNPPQQDTGIARIINAVIWGFHSPFEESKAKSLWGWLLEKTFGGLAFLWTMSIPLGLWVLIVDGYRNGFFEAWLVLSVGLYIPTGVMVWRRRHRKN